MIYNFKTRLEEILESQKEEQLQSMILKSKMRSINNYIESLLQKKARIDLEIKRQKQVLSKLQRKSKMELKLSASLETVRPLTPEEFAFIQEEKDPKELSTLIDLDKEVDRAEILLTEISSLQDEGKIPL